MNQSNLSKPYTLFLNPRSPFARRIRLALKRLDLHFEERDLGNVFEPQPELSRMNPLGMVPTLLTPEGEVLSDSTNLLEYLQEKTGRVWPADQTHRFRARQVSTWCAGLMQSSILYYQENSMHEVPSPRWLVDHAQSIEDTLQHLSQINEEVWIENNELTQCAWDLAVALEYLDFRLGAVNWRRFDSFARLHQLAQKNSFFAQTVPPRS